MKINSNRVSFNCSEKEYYAIALFVDELNRMYNTNIILEKRSISICFGEVTAEAWCKNDNK